MPAVFGTEKVFGKDRRTYRGSPCINFFVFPTDRILAINRKPAVWGSLFFVKIVALGNKDKCTIPALSNNL